jgi:hypothetical protein
MKKESKSYPHCHTVTFTKWDILPEGNNDFAKQILGIDVNKERHEDLIVEYLKLKEAYDKLLAQVEEAKG